jgi:hypothetical protein
MADLVNNAGAVSNLLRQPATLTQTNNVQQATQKFFDLVANGVPSTKVQPAEKSAGSSRSGNLPRGSLVDMLA